MMCTDLSRRMPSVAEQLLLVTALSEPVAENSRQRSATASELAAADMGEKDYRTWSKTNKHIKC